MTPTTRSKTRRNRELLNQHPRLDALAYPHIVDMILDNLPREDIVTLRSVTRSYRQHVDRLLLRHLVVRSIGPSDDGGWEHPVSIRMTDGPGPALPWRALRPKDRKDSDLVSENNKHLSQMSQLCHVLDVEDVSVQLSMSFPISSIKTLSNVKALRRFQWENFFMSVDTIIDFAGVDPEQLQLDVKCKRYVASSLDYPRCACQIDYETSFSTYDISLSHLKGLKDVVLLFVQEYVTIATVIHFLVRHEHMFKSTKFTVVGLVTVPEIDSDEDGGDDVDYVGDVGEDVLEYFKSRYLQSFSIPSAKVLSAVTFMNHDEYREVVGEDQYLLETEKGACFM